MKEFMMAQTIPKWVMKVIVKQDLNVLNLNFQMKRFWLYILSLLIFGASFQSSLLLVDYQINREFYEIHCVNKTKPLLACHGKCQIEKKESSNLVKVVKYSFEFNILPSATEGFTAVKVPVASVQKLAFGYHEIFWPEVNVKIIPAPPQV